MTCLYFSDKFFLVKILYFCMFIFLAYEDKKVNPVCCEIIKDSFYASPYKIIKMHVQSLQAKHPSCYFSGA